MGGLGERLRTAREAARLTQEEAAHAVGVKQQQISAWESGTMPPARHHHRLVEVYGLVAEDFYRWVADAHRARADHAQRAAAKDRADRDFVIGKITEFLEQYEELGHTYRSMAGDMRLLLDRALPLQEIFTEINERLARLEERSRPDGPPSAP